MANRKVLLVDDEADILKVIGSRIKSWGYELVEAINGKEAVKLVRENKADLVILDYMLPDMDGVVVLKEIRKISKKIPVIMFTAYPNPTSMHDADKLGISAYVAKISVYSDTQSLLKTAVDLAFKSLDKKEDKNEG